MNKNGIIFDLDGTLWEVIDSTFESANEIAKKHGLKEIKKETICSVFGLNKVDSAKMYFPYLDIDESLILMDEIVVRNIENLKTHGGNLYSNVKEILDELKNKYDLYIVSNTAQREYIEAFLISAKCSEYFSDYIAASQLNISKSEAIKKIINDYRLKKAVYVGDTLKDMEASRLAGIPFVQAKYGFGNDLKSKYCINEIKELPNILNDII